MMLLPPVWKLLPLLTRIHSQSCSALLGANLFPVVVWGVLSFEYVPAQASGTARAQDATRCLRERSTGASRPGATAWNKGRSRCLSPHFPEPVGEMGRSMGYSGTLVWENGPTAMRSITFISACAWSSPSPCAHGCACYSTWGWSDYCSSLGCCFSPRA